MRPSVRVTSCWLASALVLCAGVASAEDAVQPYPACNRTPTEGEVQAAKGAFQAGNGSFNEADYERAITYWEDAYRRDCTAHPLLLNLARAYELNGKKRHAVNALQTFVARNPGSPDEAQIQRRIEKLEEQIQAESAPPPQAAPQPATAAPAPATTAPPTESPPPATGKRPMTPLIVAGVGGAIAIVGTLGWAGAMNDVKKAEDKCPVHNQCPDPQVIKDGNDARGRANLFGAVAIVGLGTAIGGGVWYLVSKPKPAATATAPRGFVVASPTLAPGYGGISVAGAF